MFEAFRNSIFKLSASCFQASSKAAYLPINSRNPQELSERYRRYTEAQALSIASENVENIVANSLNEDEKKEFSILRKYVNEGMYDPAVNAKHIREQLDIIQIAKNLKMIEANQADFDPEYVYYEKLKARVLLEEEGAREEFAAYVAKRPYMRAYLKYSDAEEKNQFRMWPL